MAITIRELLASDTVSQAADKINFNFDQLLLNGGGPQGPQGPQGPPGPIGGRGIRGSVWYEDTSTTSPGNNPNTVPPTLTPEDEDNYLQFNGVVWTYDASIPAWVPTNIDLTGPVGPPGASGKFAEYQALPYTAAGDTTIFPDELSISAIGLTQGVRSVLIGGFPEGPAFTPTSIGTNIVPTAIANQLEMPNISMMVHQFDSSGTAIIFHGGDSSSGEWFSQTATSELSRITLAPDDALRISSPKERTPANLATTGIYIEAANRGIDLNAGRELTIRTGTATATDTYAGQDNFLVQVAQSAGNSVEPYASIRTVVSGQEAELRIGQTSTPATTTTNPGNLVGLAGKISLIGSDVMNLRTTTNIIVNAGTDIDINAGSTIDMIGADLVTVQSTGNNLRLWATAGASLVDVFSEFNVDVRTKTGDVHIFTGTGTGSNVLIDTSNTGSQIKLETGGDTSPINLRTNGTTSPIRLETTGTSGIILDSNTTIGLDSATSTSISAGTTIGIGATDDVSLLSSTGNINITHGIGGGKFIKMKRLSGTTDVRITAGSGTDGAYLGIYADIGGPLASDGLGMTLRSFSANESLINPIGTTDKLYIGTNGDEWDRTPWTSGAGFDPGLDVNAYIHANNHDTKLNADPNNAIFASGRFLTETISNNDTVQLNWIRVGNVVNCTGIVLSMSTNDTAPLPIGNALGSTVRGVWTTTSSQGTINDSGGSRFAINDSPGGNVFFSFSYVIA